MNQHLTNSQSFSFLVSLLIFFAFTGCNKHSNTFQSNWSQESNLERPWAGESYWLNPLQAWFQEEGKIKCITSGGDRNVALLTHSLDTTKGTFQISFAYEDFQAVSKEQLPNGLNNIGWIGMQIGLQGQFNDYRDDVIHGRGLSLGYTQSGGLFIGDYSNLQVKDRLVSKGNIVVRGEPNDKSGYALTIDLKDKDELLQTMTSYVDGSWLTGSMALTCSQSIPDTFDYKTPRPSFNEVPELSKRVGGNNTVAFRNWIVEGEKVKVDKQRTFGPILWAQHTTSDNVLKMSAQMAPIGNDNRSIELHIDGEKSGQAEIDQLGRNALFRLEQWDGSIDHSYELKYISTSGKTYNYTGRIPKNQPVERLRLASLSCVDDRGFPHQDIVEHVADHDPDMLVFHGDQLYERVGGYGVERNSILDYQRKWYIFGWSFGPLIKDKPTIIIPDDHDVFHGNLWGEGGKAADVSQGYGNFGQDSGGYKEGPDFVNMVHRTQTGHLPDPAEPTPVLQDISVYYTNMNFGGVSFAILGDRQWKTAPKQFFPNAEIENGWPQNIKWNPKTDAFHSDAELLGMRQENFLESWVENWEDEVFFKTVISQSPFCNVATLPADIWHDKYVPGLPRYTKDGYPEDDRPVADFDSNGWPQNKRDKAIEIIRKAHALHITGDQHLGSTGQYGVDDYGDSGYWIATPAVANLWPRRWFPAKAALTGKAENDERRYTGDYEDGFGNKITVNSIANPYDIDREPSMVFDKAPGYSIVDFNRNTGKIDITVWPRWASPKELAPDNQPYEGWPLTIDIGDGFGKKALGYLPTIEAAHGDLIKVYREDDGALVYAKRLLRGSFQPKVFDLNTTYSVVVNGKRTDMLKAQ